MAGDNLRAILGMIRAEIPGVPEETWSQIERALRGEFGGQRAYIAEHKKRSHLEALAAEDQAASNADLARKLGLSVSRIKQLKRLR